MRNLLYLLVILISSSFALANGDKILHHKNCGITWRIYKIDPNFQKLMTDNLSKKGFKVMIARYGDFTKEQEIAPWLFNDDKVFYKGGDLIVSVSSSIKKPACLHKDDIVVECSPEYSKCNFDFRIPKTIPNSLWDNKDLQYQFSYSQENWDGSDDCRKAYARLFDDLPTCEVE